MACCASSPRGRQLVAIEQQGHGRTADLDRPLTFEQMALDTMGALRALRIERADFFGYSDGGILALRIAMLEPSLVGKLAPFGANHDVSGLAPGLVEAFTRLDPNSLPPSFRAAYEAVAPNPRGFDTLVAKVMQQAVTFSGWTLEQLGTICIAHCRTRSSPFYPAETTAPPSPSRARSARSSTSSCRSSAASYHGFR